MTTSTNNSRSRFAAHQPTQPLAGRFRQRHQDQVVGAGQAEFALQVPREGVVEALAHGEIRAPGPLFALAEPARLRHELRCYPAPLPDPAELLPGPDIRLTVPGHARTTVVPVIDFRRLSTKVVLVLLPAVLVAGCSSAASEWPSGVPGPSGTSGDPDTDPAQGGIPDGQTVTPFDLGYPAVSKLDPALLKAVQHAATDARRERGIVFTVTSGWRTKAYQQRLLEEGIDKYGSLEKARRYVNTPEKSTHVTGEAVDLGPTEADDWLIRHGPRYGLCRTYANELWHFELSTTPGGECPRPLPNAAG